MDMYLNIPVTVRIKDGKGVSSYVQHTFCVAAHILLRGKQTTLFLSPLVSTDFADVAFHISCTAIKWLFIV